MRTVLSPTSIDSSTAAPVSFTRTASVPESVSASMPTSAAVPLASNAYVDAFVPAVYNARPSSASETCTPRPPSMEPRNASICAPTRSFVSAPTVVFWNVKAPVIRTKPAISRTRLLPCNSWMFSSPAPKIRSTVPPGVVTLSLTSAPVVLTRAEMSPESTSAGIPTRATVPEAVSA